ncbi:Polynucleotide 5'-hydroxyl-kinase grc3 [Rasamsonia emersonii CBS 393.64]|uniref:Polynucleotide 5'-hydroxyl-kinase GRC3 n=1 Tax=Rasamsonia emersonii (strain ATCC 16479 / CBS 393.64 / IMI 116815) TaxID=1408163 RepID=A0A0F4YV38_RASE3|nr:Polynucleotide 5'-hydroxyl-kinase grc3 [Rasamsonia emersonii CBS 393.64]KKA21975.1 Polynucleotide 5'-hydroxyl-kinase grc3 [Rasamsonia emersonii CBS 393.64]
MKRKAEKQQEAAPVSAVSAVSAIAARRAQLQQSQIPPLQNTNSAPESDEEPPAKKARPSPARETNGRQEVTPKKGSRGKSGQQATVKSAEKKVESTPQTPDLSSARVTASDVSDEESEEYTSAISDGGEENETGLSGEDEQGFESPSNVPEEIENFTLSKTRLNKTNVVYSDERVLCVRIKEKMNLVLIGVYDIWVKRGVISLMGAKLHPSPKLYRVYAPSTHSLPVIKCVSGVEGYAEVEIQSSHSGIYRLKELSPLYHRIWNSGETAADKVTLKGSSRRTFSVLYTSSDDPLKRHLRPLHLEKKWSATIKVLSQRGSSLRVLICGPKGSGKSTFSRYLLNHLLSPAPQTEGGYSNPDGVAFLDLDPGQPEFSPMGEIYLAHLREPTFGPPFSHPTLDRSSNGKIVRAHHIGANSPKEDPDHYVMAAMNLMDQYRALLATYPQCPLIINFPGWIFGLGLEVAMWLVRSLGLSDVVYMSEKGPSEVVEPLGHAAGQARVPLTTLPSQPIDYVTRSSAQLRSMQMQSYFHMSQPDGCQNPIWSEIPLAYSKPILVDYAGPRQGILGIMVLGNRHDPDLLRGILDGAIVSIVAVESLNAIPGYLNKPDHRRNGAVEAIDADAEEAGMLEDEDQDDVDKDVDMSDVTGTTLAQQLKESLEPNITRTSGEDLPYLFFGAGSCTPLDPKGSRSLGLALVRAIHTSSRKLELVTPIPSSKILEALKQGQGLVIVRGQLDNPDWAISEEYHAARAAEQRHLLSVARAKKRKQQETNGKDSANNESDREQQNECRGGCGSECDVRARCLG